MEFFDWHLMPKTLNKPIGNHPVEIYGWHGMMFKWFAGKVHPSYVVT